jgi:CHAT domain-containing protein/tetratricopeptide (TPR) repeat protein
MQDSVTWLVLTLLGGGFTSTLRGQTALEPEKSLQTVLASGQSHEYKLQLRAGDYARVVVEQRSVDVSVTCVGPAGNEILSLDSNAIGDSETVEWIAEMAGSYRLRITPTAHSPRGEYEIALHAIEPSTERHRVRIAASLAFDAAMNARRPGTREGFRRAIGYAEEALHDWRAAEDRGQEATSLVAIGLLYIEIADKQNALRYTTEALPVAESTQVPKLIGRALEAIGRVHNTFGDTRKAVEYCEKALPLLRTAGDRAGEANTLENAGVAFSGMGDKRRALVYYNQSAEIFRSLHDSRMLAEVEGNIGLVYDNLGEYERALENHANELQIARELADRATEAVTLNNVATAYTGLGEYQKALDAYTAALEINRALENEWNVSINLNNIAWVYGQLGDRQHALKFYQESLALIRKVNDQRRMAATLNNIATIRADMGAYGKAIEIHREALSLRRATGDADGEANSLFNIGSTNAKLGEWETARDHMERALAIHRTFGNRYMLARSLRGAGAVYRESGDPRRARSYLEEALQISRSIRDRNGESEDMAELAKVEMDLGNDAPAAELAGEALAALESIRTKVMSPALRSSFVASVRDVQELEIEMLMRLHARQPDGGFGAAALLACERSRARSLLDMLNESGVEIRNGVDAALLARERELSRLISAKAELQSRLLSSKHTDAEAVAAEKELDAFTLEFEQLQGRIRQVSPQYAALTQTVPLDLKEIQAKVLDEDTVLLEDALGSRQSVLWAVTPSSMQAFELPPASDIEAAARRTYDLLTARNQRRERETPAARLARVRQADAAYLAAARQLGRMLLDPAAAYLEPKRLLIVAEGILRYLPFGALAEPGTDVPLMVNHEITTAPSASVVALLRQETAGRKPAPKLLAVFADPVFHADDPRIAGPPASRVRAPSAVVTEDFARLRFSRTEAEEVSRLADPATTLKALDFDASRETAMKPDLADYRIVHFATHSVLNNEHPELSGVVLSLVDPSGHSQNGFLRLYDIYNLRLGADLVVLSACRTALGKEIKGEGLIGLTRGFLYAGAPRVMATLWEIDDRTTEQAMKRFYEGMLGRGERPAAALRTAQIELWKSKGWDAPYYWAGFILEGEWR